MLLLIVPPSVHPMTMSNMDSPRRRRVVTLYPPPRGQMMELPQDGALEDLDAKILPKFENAMFQAETPSTGVERKPPDSVKNIHQHNTTYCSSVRVDISGSPCGFSQIGNFTSTGFQEPNALLMEVKEDIGSCVTLPKIDSVRDETLSERNPLDMYAVLPPSPQREPPYTAMFEMTSVGNNKPLVNNHTVSSCDPRNSGGKMLSHLKFTSSTTPIRKSHKILTYSPSLSRPLKAIINKLIPHSQQQDDHEPGRISGRKIKSHKRSTCSLDDEVQCQKLPSWVCSERGSVISQSESDTPDTPQAWLKRNRERGTCPGLSDAIQSLLNRDNQSSSSSIVSPEGSVTDSRRNLRNRRMSTPQPIRSRASQSVSYLQSRSTRLKKARSAPDLLDIDEFGRRKVRRKRDLFRVSLSTAGDLAVQPHDYSSDSDSEDSASYGAASMSGSSLSLRQQATLEEIFEDSESPTYAEALWDHVTMDTEELGFRAGNVIEVTDLSDRNWWFGHMGDRQGWFPAPFVRLRANQIEIITDGDSSPLLPEHSAMTSLKAPLRHTESVSQAQARTNVVREILHAEREYVRHLRDVVQGYVEKCRKHPEMFSEDKLTAIFGNITAIYGLSIKFLAELEAHIDTEKPYLSNIGKVFLDHQTGFEIYSEYCNNHPTGCEELRVLQKHKKYTHFFEACRLLQNMIELPLEGFLLTPVQKICKYPLQLRELLKYTPRSHSDHMDISAALETMHRIAVMINERKRKMESLEKLAEWQLTIDDWQGQDLLDLSSELIYSGEMTKVNNGGWHQDRVFFLFDHQLIYCKKDMLWRDMLIYKGRIDLDNCVIKALPDDKDPIFNINVKNAIRIYDNAKGKWYLLYCRTPIERARWFSAFQDERQRVEEDNKNGFNLKEFRSKAHLPRGKGKVQPASVRYREHTKKQNKKHGGRHPKNNDKHKAQNAAPSTDNVDENCDSTHTKRWYNFGNRKANKR